MDDIASLFMYIMTILSINIINESFAAPSPVPANSFVFPGPSTSDDNYHSPRSLGDDYDSSASSYDDNLEDRYSHGYNRKQPRPYLSSGHGCRGHNCDYEGYGSRPVYGGYYPQNEPSAGSFATASAGTYNQPHRPNGAGAINSQANAQSASFNVGPFSASFSSAVAISGPNVPVRPNNFNY